jgi:hypothetical protein
MSGGMPPENQYQQPMYAPPAAPATNGLATAGLILGILPTGLIGLIFSILGLSRAGKVGVGKGKAMTGLILSILWMVGGVVGIVAIAGSDTVKHAVQAADPGCVAFEGQTDLAAKFGADASDPTKLAADIDAIVAELQADEGKTNNSAVKAAMVKFQGDLTELKTDLTTQTVPSADLQTRLSTDGTAIDTACGHVG